MEREVVLKKFKECGYSIYDASYAENDTAGYVLGKKAGVKHLIIIGDAPKGFVGEPVRLGDLSLLVCPLRHENAESLKKAFPWLKPVSVENRGISIGTGDRLGLVTKAHIMAVSGTGVFPVLAQQSMRELKLTGKTNLSMLDDVLWQVFEAGYRDGYAADGDHLKEIDDIKAALADGDTMITLDCSEHIPSGKAPGAAALAALFAKYCGRAFDLGKDLIKITPVQLDEIIAVYSEAIDFIEEVYRTVILPCSHTVSFEISIDETDTSTTPEAHFFLASELRKRGVRFSSLAPRFCGEFQKGIDYIGDHAQFEAELRRHA
ncbi:MAG: tagaturonate epimerase family protein, partial [Oscillospiraceae bacterium]|nr:tagaturonate epimerase family protein [Oscillospiraceae bacterium]